MKRGMSFWVYDSLSDVGEWQARARGCGEKRSLRQNKYKTCQIKQWNHLIDKQALAMIPLTFFFPENAKGWKNLALSASAVQFPNDWTELIVFSAHYVCFRVHGSRTTSEIAEKAFCRFVKLLWRMRKPMHEFLIAKNLFDVKLELCINAFHIYFLSLKPGSDTH